MLLPRPARTWLFVPSHRAALVPKAFASSADVVILDLEDSVPATEKAAGRAGIVDALGMPPARAVVVRVTVDGIATDLDAALRRGVAGILIPKATPELVRETDARATERNADVVIVPIVEDVFALEGIDRLAAESPRVRFVAFGSLDFASSVGLHPDEAEDSLDHARQHIVLASRCAGLDAPIDSPVVSLGDLDAVRRRATRSKALGCQGMLCIHPEQLDVVRDAYRPSPRQVEAARRIVALYDEAYRQGLGAVRVEGRMIDAANVGAYRRVLQEAE